MKKKLETKHTQQPNTGSLAKEPNVRVQTGHALGVARPAPTPTQIPQRGRKNVQLPPAMRGATLRSKPRHRSAAVSRFADRSFPTIRCGRRAAAVRACRTLARRSSPGELTACCTLLPGGNVTSRGRVLPGVAAYGFAGRCVRRRDAEILPRSRKQNVAEPGALRRCEIDVSLGGSSAP